MEDYIIKTSGLNTSVEFFKSIGRKANAPMTKIYNEKSPEGIVMDNLNLTRMCCRRHFMTHVDIE